jgi:hypothetical protein
MAEVPTLEIKSRNSNFTYIAGEGIIQHFKPVDEIPQKNDLRELSVEDGVDQIQSLLIGSNFCSKKLGFCYFTEEYVDEDKIDGSYLRGSYNTHRIPGGCILFSEGNDNFMECCSMQHMINNNMIDSRYLINNFPEEVKIPRSRRPGDTEDRFSVGRIIPNSASVYSTSLDTINVFVEFPDGKNGMMFKTVPIKKLMDANGIENLNIHPLIFQESYIDEQTDSVGNLLRHYNTIFTKFIEGNICSVLDKNGVDYAIEYGSFNF